MGRMIGRAEKDDDTLLSVFAALFLGHCMHRAGSYSEKNKAAMMEQAFCQFKYEGYDPEFWKC